VDSKINPSYLHALVVRVDGYEVRVSIGANGPQSETGSLTGDDRHKSPEGIAEAKTPSHVRLAHVVGCQPTGPI
jgi:hypothetical protein